MQGLDSKCDVWMSGTAFCDALEPLLRLAARTPDLFSDTTGSDERPQVRQKQRLNTM